MAGEPRRTERRIEREPRWRDLDVLVLTTRERHQAQERRKKIVDEAVICNQYIQFIDDITKRTDITIPENIRTNFLNAKQLLQAYHREVRHGLYLEPDSDRLIEQIIPNEATIHPVGLSEPEDSMSETENIKRIDDAMGRTSEPQIFSISDSHVTTAYVMKWLEEQNRSMHKVGVLSFDHHTDLREVRGAAKKDSVMTHLIEESGVGAVAVIGYDPMFAPPMRTTSRSSRIDRITGQELYQDHKPNVTNYLAQLSEIMGVWRDRGITSLYTSVDLDGLRLPEQLYTATDYNPLDNIRWLIDCEPYDLARQRLARGAAELSNVQAQEAVDWLQNMLRANQLDVYNGIPASWVTRAMRLAKEQFGLQIGVTRPGTEQRVIGDIVEFTPPDYQNRTARISRALLGSMSIVAQKN